MLPLICQMSVAVAVCTGHCTFYLSLRDVFKLCRFGNQLACCNNILLQMRCAGKIYQSNHYISLQR